jgi:hypothetical protein
MTHYGTPRGVHGEHEEISGVGGVLESLNFVKSDSMEIRNDPRFFQDNVLNKRLKAFTGVAVVSSLLVQSSMKEMFEMDKNMQLDTAQGGSRWHFNGAIQLIAFAMLLVIFMCNMLSAYVGVAQPYHTIRLMTAGATGFETATSYYLNRNIVAWRHMAIKYMLLSLPLYISQMGFRLIVKFDRHTRAAPDDYEATPLQSRVEGVIFAVLMVCLACMLYSVHVKHFEVFRDRYDSMARRVTGGEFAAYMTSMNRGAGHLDV